MTQNMVPGRLMDIAHNTTSQTVRVIRFIRLILHIISGFFQSLAYPHFSQPIQRRMMKSWALQFLNILGIKLHYSGNVPNFTSKQVLFVANHVSWLDICVIMAACPTRFVAKYEIRNWPVIGLLSHNAGALFIKRAKRSDTLRINEEITTALRAGDRVTVFPEGTTSDGTVIKHFHASLLQSAAAASVLLCPVAICYRNTTGHVSKEAAFTSPSLLFSLRQILSQPSIDAKLSFIDPIDKNEKNRRKLARLAEQAIANTLLLPIAHKKPEKSFDLPGE